MTTEATAPAERPGGATVMGILNILFGGFGTLFGLIGLLGAVAFFAVGGWATLMGVVLVLAFFLSLTEVLAGVFLLTNRKNGVLLSNVYAIVNIVVAAANYIGQIWITNSYNTAAPTNAAAVATVFNTVALVFTVSYSIILFIVLRSRSIKSFYASRP